jgi:3-oxoacyl-[acyl-carrier-protein] synthase II
VPIADFDASEFACRVAAPVPSVTIDDIPAIDGDDIWDPEYRADPKRYSRAALIGVIAAREAWAGLPAWPLPNQRRRHRRQRRRRHRRRRAAVLRLLRRAREERSRRTPIPVSIVGMVSSEISISLRLRGISHVLSCGCTVRPMRLATRPRCCVPATPDVILSGGTDACVTPG